MADAHTNERPAPSAPAARCEETVVERRLRFVVRGGATGAMLIAIGGLLGYIPSLRLLGRMRVDYFPMAPSSALCALVLAPIALSMARPAAVRRFPRWRWFGAALITLFSVLQLVGDFLSLDLTLENRLTASLGELNGMPIGRMSAATECAFLLMGVAALGLNAFSPDVFRVRRRAFIASWSATFAVLLSSTVLLAYAYGTPFTYGPGLVPMAATTAVMLWCVGAAFAAAAGPADFSLRFLLGDSTAARLSRVFIPLAIAVAPLQSALTHSTRLRALGNDAALTAATLALVIVLAVAVAAWSARSFGRDLDDRQRRLAESEERHRAVVRTAMDGFLRLDASGQLIEANDAYCRMSGFTAAELLTRRITDLESPATMGEIAERMRVIAARGSLRFESQHRHRDGSAFDVAVSIQASADTTGELVAFVQDITDRKRSDLEREVMHDIKQSVSASQDLNELLALTHRALQRVLEADNCFVALYDPAQERFSFPYFADQYDQAPAPVAMPASCTAYVLRTGEPALIRALEFGELTARGEVQLVGSPSPSWMGVPLRTPSGTIGVLVVQHYERSDVYTARDLAFLTAVGALVALVIERTLAEAARRDNAAELDVILASTADGILAVNGEGKVLHANRRFAELWRLPPGMVEARDDDALLQYVLDQLTDPEAFIAQVRALYGSSAESRDTLRFTDGRVFARYSTPLVIDGAMTGRVWSFHDDTDRVRAAEEQAQLEEELRQAQKMESVGRLAGGIAHDFNNMLGVILGNVEFALAKADLPEGTRADLGEIQRAATRSADLTRQLLAYARKQRIVPRVLDLNDTVSRSLQMLQRMIGEDVTLAWQPSALPITVHMDPTQVEQILANLCVNARDAIVDVGHLTVWTERRTLDARFCATHPDATRGEFAVLAVRDDGCGMSADLLTRIFEPFFTTKEVGEGTGLGLATVYGAVRQNDGFVTVESTPSAGTTFEVFLPRYEGAERATWLVEDAAGVVGGRETILVVEDEPAMLRMTSRTLDTNGYRVLRANSAAEAMRIAAAHAGEIDLLVTDVVMPDMNGRDLARTLTSEQPRIRVLFMSGFTTRDGRHAESLDDDADFIAKPFALSALSAKVREVLDRR